ncbi:hypothetical protein IL306_015216, partial [Fusarium sp. DS 682]
LSTSVRDTFISLSLFLELHFVQDLNSYYVSQLLEKKQHDRWGEYLAQKESLATATVVENANDEMHAVLLVRGMLEFAGHITSVCHYQYDQEKTINDSCLILGLVLGLVFEPKDTNESEDKNEPPGRMRIPRPLGANEVRERLARSGYPIIDITGLCAKLPLFLPVGVPIRFRETLPETLANSLKYGVVMDALRAM